MRKLNVKNLISFSFMLVALTFVFAMPNETNAYYVGKGYYLLGSDSSSRAGNNNGNNNSNNSQVERAPIVNSISPNVAQVNTGGRVITIKGSGFTPTSIAKFNGQDRATTYVSPNQLLVDLADQDTKVLGKHIISVFNPGTEGAYSNGVFFTVNETGKIAGATTNTTKSTTTSTTKTTTAKAPTVVTQPATTVFVAGNTNNNQTSSRNNQSANALFGLDGFMPKTIFGWLLLSILILFVILLWRRIWVTDAQRRAPLKHA